ncbi:MAG: ROK family protein [Acidimicrobiales bacterium]
MRTGRNGGGTDHAVMRELNRSLVLDVLKQQSPISRAAIAKETKLAKPTISAIVDALLTEGLATEIGTGKTTAEGGRPPILLEFNARSQFFAGVHIGVRRTTVVIANAGGATLARRDLDTPRSAAADALQVVAEVVDEMLGEVKASRKRVGGVGVCVPGLVDLEEGVCLLAPNLGWRNVAVRTILGNALGGPPVYVHNTAQACAVAETLQGAAKGAADVVLLYAGTGVGAGLIADERLYLGAMGITGEIGHVKVEGAVAPCSCGKFGCLETVVSGPALSKAARAKGLGGDDLALRDLVALADSGDATARGLFEEAGRHLGLAASWLVNLFNPEVLVVGGGLAEAGDLLLGPVRAAVAEFSIPQATEHLAIRPWSLGQDAKVQGAVLVAMQRSERFVRVIFGAEATR